MQSLTNGVYSLLLGGEGEATGAALPPPMQPMQPMQPPSTTPTPTSCGGNPGVPTFVVLGPGDGSVACLDECLAMAEPMVREATSNLNRVTVVLLKTSTTPAALRRSRKYRVCSGPTDFTHSSGK